MASLEHEFPARDDQIFLNHAGLAPWPRRAADAVAAFARENFDSGPAHYERWAATETALREQGRALLGAASADDIALLKNTSEGLSIVAYGMPWTAGDNIVTSAEEFPSNRIVWESLRDQGVGLREAEIHAVPDPEAALFALCDERTRLVTVSSVQYASGLRMDLARIGAFCRERGIAFCVDAIQSLGALQIDARAIHADAVIADGHKWMLGPEGIALFYTRPGFREQLRLTQYGWHMVDAIGDYERRDWRPAGSARRFECGSPNMLGIHGLHASLGLLLEIGLDKVEQRVLDNARYLIELIDETDGLELLSSRDPARLSGIVVFKRPGIGATALFQALRAAGVQCAPRGGGVRFSPHCHTRREEIRRAVRLALA